MTSCWLLCTPGPFCEGIYSIRKEFAPKGSKFFPFRVGPLSEGKQEQFDIGSRFFPFRVDPLSERKQKQFDRVASPEKVSVLHLWHTDDNDDLLFYILFNTIQIILSDGRLITKGLCNETLYSHKLNSSYSGI